MFALYYFPDSRSVEPLCRFFESGVNILINETAMSHLGCMGDAKAIPTLAKVLLDTDNKFDQSIRSAGQALGKCGPKGVDVLIAALDHADHRVRGAAVVGIDISQDPRADALLDRITVDPNPSVRERAAIRFENPFGL